MVNYLQSESDPDARLTFSTGTINGGDQVNRIPDAVTLLTDWRVPNGMASAHCFRENGG